ncbi:MAG: acyltransferase [Prevotella sp.]|nr:acyltransferase [Prevotella sp.]
MNRFRQVSHYAWLQSNDIAKAENKGLSFRVKIYFDMMRSFLKYRMWTNQYIKENFYKRTAEERKLIGVKCLESGIIRDAWQKDFRENRKFLIKYTNIKYEKASLREKRNKAYTERYHAGKKLFVEYDVNISRQHYLEGTITIGDNVLFAKHTFIDYSGDLIIHDNVKLSDGVSIETHSHPAFTSATAVGSKKEKLEIFEFVNLGAKSFVTESCHKIGRYAKIGAGTVLRSNVPPYAIVIGNPAKIIGFVFSPEEMGEFEKKHYPENERTSIEKYRALYNKYYKDRLNIIKEYYKL